MSELLMLKGMISEMPKETQDKIKQAVQEIVATIEEFGEEGLIALALVGGEYESKGMKV